MPFSSAFAIRTALGSDGAPGECVLTLTNGPQRKRSRVLPLPLAALVSCRDSQISPICAPRSTAALIGGRPSSRLVSGRRSLQCRAAPDRSRNRRRFSRVGLLRRRCSDRWTEAPSLDSSCSTNVSFKKGLFRSAFPHRVAAGSSRASRAWIRGGAGLAKLWRRFWKRPGSRSAAVSAASASWEHCVSETAREQSGCAPISTRWPCSRRPIAPPSGRSDDVTSSIISSRARVQPNSRTAASQIIVSVVR
jgi:hypothetical protein